jgi:hypothetical protein
LRVVNFVQKKFKKLLTWPQSFAKVTLHAVKKAQQNTINMRKTLLIAAATLAAGVIAAQADAVYSQNIVGYYNVTVPVNGFALVGHQLDLDGTNGISSIFASGLVSDPDAVKNTQIFLWNASSQQYQTLQYFNAADAAADWSGAAGFYDTGGTYYNTPLPPGTSAFIYNYANTSSNLTVTLVGTVPQKTNVYTIVQGYNLFTLTVPVVTNLCSSLANFSGTSDPDAVNNDQIYLWNASSQQYQTLQYFNAADASADWSGVAGFYDTGGTYYNVAPAVGSGFFIRHIASGTEYWTNSFSF